MTLKQWVEGKTFIHTDAQSGSFQGYVRDATVNLDLSLGPRVNAKKINTSRSREIDETITDPYLNAWYDARGAENADKCAWTFGATQNSGGSLYNFTSGSYKYLIQQNWLADNKVTSTGTSSGTACSVTGN